MTEKKWLHGSPRARWAQLTAEAAAAFGEATHEGNHSLACWAHGEYEKLFRTAIKALDFARYGAALMFISSEGQIEDTELLEEVFSNE